jgi:undecaprenyl-diphosphatase
MRPWPRSLPRTAGVILLVWLALIGLLIAVGKSIEHSDGIQSWDRRITTWLVDHRTSGLNEAMKVVTWAGSWVAALVLTVLVGALAWRRRLPLFAVFAIALAWLGELAAVHLTKAVVHRPRPPEEIRVISAHGWSFPSGHTANAVVVFTGIALVLTAFVRSKLGSALIWTLMVMMIGLVGFSRIELGVHWTTDVLASAIWTTMWLLVLRALHIRTARSGPSDE